MLGTRDSKETREKKAIASLKQWQDPEFKSSTVASMKAHWDEPARQRQRERMLGTSHSDETRHKMSQSSLGRKMSDESRTKMKQSWSPERKAAQAERMRKMRSEGVKDEIPTL